MRLSLPARGGWLSFSTSGLIGYAAGAIVAGTIADLAGFPAAIITAAALTGISGLIVAIRMRETLPHSLLTEASGRRYE